MDRPDDLEILTFDDAEQWEAWLARHHDRQTGVWLKIAKKGSGQTSVTITDALDVVLCYGWIDSQRKGYDETCYLQKYSPRRPTSSWSKVNVDKVERLMAAGRMQEPGLAQVRAAQADGRWASAYESQKNATVPPDLAAALAESARAKAFFDQLGKTDRYQVIVHLLRARTAQNRADRLRTMVALMEAGKKPR